MNQLSLPQFGFLPSLEAMPLVKVLSEGAEWKPRPRCSYGNIIRGLITNDLQAGLMPWELFVSDLLLQPNQAEAWAVVQVIRAMPVELVLSGSARKRLYPTKSSKVVAWSTRLRFAIEGRRSLARLQLHSWLSKFATEVAGKPSFKMLPVDLMLKGLEENAIDGMIAPTPWGRQAEAMGAGKLDPNFEVGRFGQNVVMVCRRELVTKYPNQFGDLSGRIAMSQDLLNKDPVLFRKVVQQMEMAGAASPGSALFEAAAALDPWPVGSVDFIPEEGWLLAELQNLVGLMLVPSDSGDVQKMAGQLVYAPEATSR